MATKIEVANRSLALLGEEPIGSLTEGSVQAATINALYDGILDERLASFRWRFARKRASLSLSPDLSPEGFSQYVLPPDRLVLIGLVDNAGAELGMRVDGNLAVLIEGVTPTTVYADYICRPPHGDIPEFFIKALVFEVTSQISMAITEDVTKANYWVDKAIYAWRTARAVDSQQTTQAMFREDELVTFTGR